MTAAEALSALATGQVPPDTVYIQVETPLGGFATDPFAASQDPATQAMVQKLGIHVTLGFGPPPAPVPGQASLGQNLTIGATLAVGALALYLRPKLSTAIFVGGMALLLNRGMLASSP
jgi:hypothetical protein